MRRPLMALLIAGVTVWTHAAFAAPSPLYVTPDVPTSETATFTTLLPWEIYRYDGAGPSYTLALSVPGTPQIDAIHKMDAPGDWAFSIDAPNDLAGSLGAPAETRSIIRFDASVPGYSLFFCGATVTPAVPAGSAIDAITLDGGDAGDLILSFDVPTTVGASTFEPGDLVRWEPTGGGTCSSWMLAASPLVFDASSAGSGIAVSSILTGADLADGRTILSFDVPTDAGPPGVTTYVPGDLVGWDGVGSYSLFESLSGWPISSLVDGFSCLANPGRTPATLMVARSTITPGDLTLTWSASCSEGGEDYGIYEGTLGSFYSHAQIDCTDDGADLTEEVTPAAGDTYYLVPPHNAKEEGSYRTDSSGTERPVGSSVCATPQVVTACP